MHSGAGSYHGEHDRTQARASPTCDVRRGVRFYRYTDHVVHRCTNRWLA